MDPGPCLVNDDEIDGTTNALAMDADDTMRASADTANAEDDVGRHGWLWLFVQSKREREIVKYRRSEAVRKHKYLSTWRALDVEM